MVAWINAVLDFLFAKELDLCGNEGSLYPDIVEGALGVGVHKWPLEAGWECELGLSAVHLLVSGAKALLDHLLVLLRVGSQVEIAHHEKVLGEDGDKKCKEAVELVTADEILADDVVEMGVDNVDIANYEVLDIPPEAKVHERMGVNFEARTNEDGIAIEQELRVRVKWKRPLDGSFKYLIISGKIS